MIKIVTVCGNGIGSSLLLRMKVEAIASSLGIDVDAESQIPMRLLERVQIYLLPLKNLKIFFQRMPRFVSLKAIPIVKKLKKIWFRFSRK